MAEAKMKFAGTTMLFPTPLLAFEIEDAARINAQLLEEIAARREIEKGVKRSNNKAWHSGLVFSAARNPRTGNCLRP